MITPSAVRTVWKQRYTPQKKSLGIIHIPRGLHHSKANEQKSGFNAEQIDKDKYPESKNCFKIKSKITSQHNKTKQKPFDHQINEL
jgi:hypothetical protein